MAREEFQAEFCISSPSEIFDAFDLWRKMGRYFAKKGRVMGRQLVQIAMVGSRKDQTWDMGSLSAKSPWLAFCMI